MSWNSLVSRVRKSTDGIPIQFAKNSHGQPIIDRLNLLQQIKLTTGQQFALEFGGMAALNNLSELGEACATLLSPLLEFEYSKMDCSQLTMHMWAHAKDQDFATKAELYSWVCNNWEIEIVHKSSIISNMKTAGTKKCSLCMQDRTVLFKAFHQRRTPTNNFMNSKNEMYGKCSYQT